MKLIIFICVTLSLSVSSVYSIRCLQGAVVTSALVNINNLTDVQCPTEANSCIRGEGMVDTTVIGTVEVSAIGLCSNDTVCNDNCARLGDLVIQQFILGGLPLPPGVDLSSVYNVTSCASACCNSDLCNERTVQEIEEDMSATTTAMTTTTPTEAPTFEETTRNVEAELTTTQGVDGLKMQRCITILMSFMSLMTVFLYC